MIKNITPQQAKNSVEYILDLANERIDGDEYYSSSRATAHIKEDMLMEDFIRFISETQSGELKEIADIILSLNNPKNRFDHWYE
jgi:hypothetical protein